ncbi:hypothetical protein BDV35DRAFT_369272 [Aspergillus flavus]|uniref:Uncharacterized protein n=1 Tax=Aspergillus flavus TaxID=5059 RepID=A0A5N6GKA0_ASPFL|nr:hypothetical protein BDV35DRAFT_369272 [Aspergillus flavus]
MVSSRIIVMLLYYTYTMMSACACLRNTRWLGGTDAVVHKAYRNITCFLFAI